MHLFAVASLKNRALIALITIVVAIFGGIALTSLKQELIPSIQFPTVTVVTEYSGASPEVVNDSVSVPIEQAIQGISSLESTSATSTANRSLVTATFTYGTNLAEAEQKLSQAINRIRSSLPDDLDPQVVSGGIDDLPVLQVAITGGDDAGALAASVRDTALPSFEDVDGVRAASLSGEIGQRITITPDQDELDDEGLTTQAIRDAISSNGVLVPAGEITEDGETLSVQSGEQLSSVKEIRRLPLLGATPELNALGVPITGADAPTIDDVASVELTNDPVTSISRVNGEPALTVAITKLPAGNTVEVSRAVLAALPAIEETVGEDIGETATFTVVFDQAPFIQESIESLATEGLLGLGFAVLIILIFLLSVRATLVTAISIPTSVLMTFVGLQAFGYTLNIITLGALTIAIGRVVDDSIVVIENIKRHLGFPDVAVTGRIPSIVAAVREVAGAVTASTITTVAVFLPLSFVGGSTGELFRPFALTVTIALLASLLVSLTIVPVLAYWFLGSRAERAVADSSAERAVAMPSSPSSQGPQPVARSIFRRGSRRQLGSNPGTVAPLAPPVKAEKTTWLQRGYLPVLSLTLRAPVVTLLIAVLVLGGTIALVPLMKTNFLGSSGQNTLTVSQTLDPAASLEVQDEAATTVEQVLLDTPGVELVQVTIGSSGSSLAATFGGGSSGSVSFSVTTDGDADQEALQADVRDRLDDLSDIGEVTVGASQGFGTSSSIDVDVTARTQDALNTASDAVLEAVQGVDSVVDVTSNLSNSSEFIAVTVDRADAAAAGYSEVQLARFVSAAMQPTTVGTITMEDRQFSIYLEAESSPKSRKQLADLNVPTPDGDVDLDTLAQVEDSTGPASITTSDNFRSATISATPKTDNLGTASADVQAAVSEANLPSGSTASLGGATADQGDAFSQLGLALLIAILIVYIVMVATFRSLLQPLLLLVSIPFAATGAILLQIVSGIPLGVASLIGVLMLIGIVVTNAIVLIDLVNQYRLRGRTVHDALIDGASRRLRPILMTALATIFALLPMALGVTGQGGFISQPLALVVIGGLISSTVLTLIVLPVLYLVVEGARERRATRQTN